MTIKMLKTRDGSKCRICQNFNDKVEHLMVEEYKNFSIRTAHKCIAMSANKCQ
jgi:hypothetical protein